MSIFHNRFLTSQENTPLCAILCRDPLIDGSYAAFSCLDLDQYKIVRTKFQSLKVLLDSMEINSGSERKVVDHRER